MRTQHFFLFQKFLLLLLNCMIKFSNNFIPSSLDYLYKYYPGKNRFFCNGRLITGPKEDVVVVIFGWILILVVTVFYFIFIAPLIWSEMIAIHVLVLCFLALTIISYLLTSCTDPGIVPRKTIFEIYGDLENKFIGQANEGIINNFKFCSTCKICRPPRSTHCRFLFREK